MTTIRLLEGPFDGGKVYESSVTQEGAYCIWQFSSTGKRVKGYIYKMLDADRAMYQYVEVEP